MSFAISSPSASARSCPASLDITRLRIVGFAEEGDIPNRLEPLLSLPQWHVRPTLNSGKRRARENYVKNADPRALVQHGASELERRPKLVA
jgi:hypothetical protein